MASFPILAALEVRNYGLYPGKKKDGVLSLAFEPGLTLVLGANGLGKTTLITMMFRLLTGPFDLDLPDGSIGTAELKAGSLNHHAVRSFAARVNDGAVDASATLAFDLGGQKFKVSRSLANLSLSCYSIDGKEQERSETGYQRHVTAAANVATFGEWILVLRTMVFFFEDRRALVWDTSAQRQLLRCLLLQPEQATKWAEAERAVLSLDTRMRNLQAATRREERELADVERKAQAAPGVVAALRAAETAVERLLALQENLADRLEVSDKSRHRDRLDLLRAQAEHDSAVRELERARLAAVESRFPAADESMRYIVAHLMANDECLVCNTKGRSARHAAFIAAIDKRQCVMCDAPLNNDHRAVDIGDERIDVLRAKVETTLTAVGATTQVLQDSTNEYDKANKELAQCAADLADRQQHITALVNQLPPGEKAARQQHEELRGLQRRVSELRKQLKDARDAFAKDMNAHRGAIRRFAAEIKQAFEAAAQGFLVEDSGLTWSTVRETVGQAGSEGATQVEYPAFAVDLSGADFANTVRRDGPDQVSESQREFIDLAFRMALIKVAASNKAGSIVIDAPESSLDAVFVDRAAVVLARFANSNKQNRLLATSNLAASPLIPAMLIAAEKKAAKRIERIVDLFDLGMPTKAMKELANEYDKHKKDLKRQISKDSAK